MMILLIIGPISYCPKNQGVLTDESAGFNVGEVIVAEIESDQLTQVLEGLPADVADVVVGQAQVGDDWQPPESVLRQVDELKMVDFCYSGTV